MQTKVDNFFDKVRKWKEEMSLLREVVLSCKLTETFKWMHPCYTQEEANIVLIHGFKDYCALLFFKGVLMKDPEKILVQQTTNVQDRRQLRFRNLEEIRKQAPVIRNYIKEAMQVEKAGLNRPIRIYWRKSAYR